MRSVSKALSSCMLVFPCEVKTFKIIGLCHFFGIRLDSRPIDDGCQPHPLIITQNSGTTLTQTLHLEQDWLVALNQQLLLVPSGAFEQLQPHPQHPLHYPEPSSLNVQNLSSELKMIINWYHLGLCLNLQTHELKKIQQDYQGNDQQKLVMLDLWLRHTPNGTWEDVVSALQQMGENRVAENIQLKHNRRASKQYSIVSVDSSGIILVRFLIRSFA